MTRQMWSVITNAVIVAYGIFLLCQVFWPGWSIIQGGVGLDIAKIVGAVVLIGWAASFHVLK